MQLMKVIITPISYINPFLVENAHLELLEEQNDDEIQREQLPVPTTYAIRPI